MHTTRPTLSALQGKVLFPEITIHLQDPCLSIYHRLEAHHRYFTSKQADTWETVSEAGEKDEGGRGEALNNPGSCSHTPINAVPEGRPHSIL